MNLELDLGHVPGERIREPQVRPNGRSGVFHGLHFGCATRDATRQLNHAGEVATHQAVQHDAEAKGVIHLRTR